MGLSDDEYHDAENLESYFDLATAVERGCLLANIEISSVAMDRIKAFLAQARLNLFFPLILNKD